MDNVFLAFVDYEGKSVDGKYIYRFDFTIDKETAWGDYFNIAPSIIVPGLVLDKNCVSSYLRCIIPVELITAKGNSCFSMQDCIDGILPLAFCEIGPDMLKYEGKPLNFMFGERIDEVRLKLYTLGLPITIEADVEKDNTIIDDLINSLDEND